MGQFRKLAFLTALLATTTSASAEEVLRGVSALPENNVITQKFLQYIDLVNTAGEGVVRIELVGGPEAIPPTQQDTALRNGVVDIQSGPSGYYTGVVPEAEAFTGATVGAAEARENGAFDMLRQVWRERLGAELLAWSGAETQYYIYLTREPTLNENGDITFEGMRLRSVATYRDWFDALGAENILMEQSEVFGALERGIVEGFGFISFVSDAGLNRLIAARVGPAVWQGSPVIMMNAARYDGLSPEAQEILQAAALALEADIADSIGEAMAEEEARLLADGVTFIELEGEARQDYLDLAYSVVWDKLAETAPEFTAEIRPLLYPQN